jgi:hypothetical protein
MILSFKEFMEATQTQTLGSLYENLLKQFPGQGPRIRGILKDLAPTMVPNYHSYTRPNPEHDADRKRMGLPPIQRMGPELAPLPEQLYSLMMNKVIDVLHGRYRPVDHTPEPEPLPKPVAKPHRPDDFVNQAW